MMIPNDEFFFSKEDGTTNQWKKSENKAAAREELNAMKQTRRQCGSKESRREETRREITIKHEDE